MKHYQKPQANEESVNYDEQRLWLDFIKNELKQYRRFDEVLSELKYYDQPLLHQELVRRKQFLLDLGCNDEKLHQK